MNDAELDDIRIGPAGPSSPLTTQAMRAYIDDVASRYYGRPATDDEIERGLEEHPVDDLVAPYGVFIVAVRDDTEVCGCVALARISATVGEVRRLHVRGGLRRHGLGRRLMLAVEDQARELGLTELRLDTRNDLVESQRLYVSLGYAESEPHSGGPYSDLWYRKSLG